MSNITTSTEALQPITKGKQIDIMVDLLNAVRGCLAAGDTDQAWTWYRVFTAAWVNFRAALVNEPGYTALRDLLAYTQGELAALRPVLIRTVAGDSTDSGTGVY